MAMPAPAEPPRRRHRPAAERARLEAQAAVVVVPHWQSRDWSPYPCMTDAQWARYSAAPPLPEEDPDLAREACRDCRLPYQVAMERENRCWPADYRLTPKGRGERLKVAQ